MPVNLPTTVLRSFVAIVDAGSMLNASEQVFVTQSALSLQIKRLEELLQQPLFRREGRRLSLTPAGEVMLDYARRVLSLHDEAIATISSGSFGGAGPYLPDPSIPERCDAADRGRTARSAARRVHPADRRQSRRRDAAARRARA